MNESGNPANTNDVANDTSAATGKSSPPSEGWWQASDGRWYPPEPTPEPPSTASASASASTVSDADSTPASQRRSLWGRFRGLPTGIQVAAWIVAAVVVIAAIAAPLSSSTNTAGNDTASEFNTPTSTAKTTTKAAPTTTTTTIPPPTALSGSGDEVVDIDLTPYVGAVAVIHNSGSSNFTVSAIGAGNEQLDLLVNEIGPYQGTVLLPREPVVIVVTADGNWTLDVTA